MKLFILVLFLFMTSKVFASTYIGGTIGYAAYSSDPLEKYNVTSRGPTFGGFIGVGFNSIGIEGFYQQLNSTGEISHDDEKQNIIQNASAMGVATRVSFNIFYFRLGLAKYNLDQSIDSEPSNSRTAAEGIYEVQPKGSAENGAIGGIGIHTKLDSGRCFLDYTRYQINGTGFYDTISVGVSYNIPDSWLN